MKLMNAARLVRVLACGLLVACSAGCGGSKNYDRYITSATTARAALETALTAWQENQPYGTIHKGPAAIEVVDAQWRDGEKLAGFEVLSDEPGDGAKWFSVRLNLQGSEDQQMARYVVIGQDPLWVYREEEF